jgi:hypothetical protein
VTYVGGLTLDRAFRGDRALAHYLQANPASSRSATLDLPDKADTPSPVTNHRQ